MQKEQEKQEINYKKLGLKCGIEIHQQIDSHKLFCECPSILRSDVPDMIIKRRLYAVAGEEGKIDIAAAYEQEKSESFIYEGYSDSTCQVEFDSEPPHKLNQEVLKIAIQISLLLNAKIIPISQIMRKTVVDGSNTSGFQRTMFLAKDGYVETKYGKIGISNISLEEDSARIIKEEKNSVTYRLDRLGIPLIEIATRPDIPNAEAAKETALKIGEILRACKVKRGIGTIRQDVNLSISNGARTEIKGVQEPNLISKTIDKEIERQLKLIKEKKKVESSVRKALENGESEFLRPLPGAARMYPETDLPLIKIMKEMLEEAKKTLPKLKAEHREELGKKGLHEELIKEVLQENKLKDFEVLIQVYHKPELVAKMLTIWPKEIKTKLREKQKIPLIIDILETILQNIKQGKLEEREVKQVMEEIASGKSMGDILKREKLGEENLESEISKIVREKPGLSINAYMGLVMAKFKGKIDARKAMEILSRIVG